MGESGSQPTEPTGPPVDAVDLLLDAHWDALCRYARPRVRESASVEDVVQETLLAALRDQDRFRDESAVRTWLIGILRHKIADYWRQRQRREAVEQDTLVEALFTEGGRWRQRPGDWTPDPAQLTENEDFWNAMEQCLDGLPETARSAFSLRVIDGLASEGVCKALEISPTNLWVLLHRARLRLRTCLEKRWFDGSKRGGAK